VSPVSGIVTAQTLVHAHAGLYIPSKYSSFILVHVMFLLFRPLSSSQRIANASLALMCCVFAAGCAVTEKKPATPEQMQETMAQANASAQSGEYDKALQLLDKAAKDSPAAKDPWLRTAQIHFDQGKYGPAIVAAQEVLQRDPNDRTAKSILAVAGLRVSVKALGDLRSENGLSGSTRSEAQALTASLREALGESTLVPPIAAPAEKPAARAPATRPASGRSTRHSAATTPASTTEPASAAKDAAAARVKNSGSGNPFGALQ
jgi:tetratricopeptide (TPR) repeat protein